MEKCGRSQNCCGTISGSSCKESALSCRSSPLRIPARILPRGFTFTTRWVRNSKWPTTPRPARDLRPSAGFFITKTIGGKSRWHKWGKKPLAKLGEDEAVTLALRALDTAAESDTATGGVDRNAKIFPVIKIVSRDGITTLPEKRIAALFKRSVA